MAVQRTLEMDFSTEMGKTRRIRVSEARNSLTAAEISAVMDSIVSKNIFSTTSGDINGKLEARIVNREVSAFTLV